MSTQSIQNIIILGPAHPFRGGIASFNERLATELKSVGKDVKILTYTTQYPSLIFPGKDQFTNDPAPSDLSIERTFSTINPLSWRKTIQKIRKANVDLVLSRFWLPYTSLSTNYIHRKLRTSNQRQLSIVDNLIPHQHMPGDQYLIKQFLTSVDNYICLSTGVQKDLLSLKKQANSNCILHPVYDHYGDILQKEEAASVLKLNPDFNYLLFFGFIKPYKGLDLLLDSLDKDTLKKYKLKLLIAGDVYGSAKPYLDIIERKQLSEFVIFHQDYIPNDKVPAYFSIADLVVQPYRTATQSGISQIALFYEKPVVVTDVGSLADFVDHQKTGYVVPVDKKEIAASIEQHFANDNHQVMEEAIKKQKQQFSWKSFTEDLLQFANSLQT